MQRQCSSQLPRRYLSQSRNRSQASVRNGAANVCECSTPPPGYPDRNSQPPSAFADVLEGPGSAGSWPPCRGRPRDCRIAPEGEGERGVVSPLIICALVGPLLNPQSLQEYPPPPASPGSIPWSARTGRPRTRRSVDDKVQSSV